MHVCFLCLCMYVLCVCVCVCVCVVVVGMPKSWLAGTADYQDPTSPLEYEVEHWAGEALGAWRRRGAQPAQMGRDGAH
jgi:hypothetical protein